MRVILDQNWNGKNTYTQILNCTIIWCLCCTGWTTTVECRQWRQRIQLNIWDIISISNHKRIKKIVKPSVAYHIKIQKIAKPSITYHIRIKKIMQPSVKYYIRIKKIVKLRYQSARYFETVPLGTLICIYKVINFVELG